MAFTRNLRLRLSDNLTDDARYNLERIDQLGAVFPIGNSASQAINSSSSISLNANSTLLGGNGDGTVFAPNLSLKNSLKLESGAYTLSLTAGALTEDLSLTLPSTVGSAGQFLSTDGTGVLSWIDPPSTNLSSLNDTLFTDLEANQFIQYNGSKWVNVDLPAAREANVYTWAPVDGNTKIINHSFNSTSIQVWIYEPASKSPIVIEEVDYLDNDTIFLRAHTAPETDYVVHLQQTA